MFGWHRVRSRDGWKAESGAGKVFISFGDLFLMHMSLGRLSISIDEPCKHRDRRRGKV